MSKKIYLTIDDCPSERIAEKINILIYKKIPAVLFCIGNKIHLHEKTLIDAVKNGIILGNHCYTHRPLSQLTTREAIEEIIKTDLLIENLYKKVSVERKIRLIRFPFGDKGDVFDNKTSSTEKQNKVKTIQDVIKKLNYKLPDITDVTLEWVYQKKFDKFNDLFWTFDLTERNCLQKTVEKTKEYIDSRFKTHILNRDSAEILLIHDHPEMKTFEIIIDILQKNRVEFARFNQS
jgi:peptidoglycan/xylan/chitin deacetylase (PgdA/CDA1 family)